MEEQIEKEKQVKLILSIATGIIVVALWGTGIISLISYIIKLLSYPIALCIVIFVSFNLSCYAGSILADSKTNIIIQENKIKEKKTK